MMTKKDAPGAGTPNASAQGAIKSSIDIIPQRTQKCQVPETNLAGEKTKKGKNSKVRPVNVHDTRYSIAIKCYDEQMPEGVDSVLSKIREIDKTKYHVLAICHDKDKVTDGIWEVSDEKRHWHIIIRGAEKRIRFRVGGMMNALGVVFRRGIDDGLWTQHGVEPVVNFPGYAMYLTHETPEAVKDGKELYDVSAIVSNLTPEEVDRVRDGYSRVTVGKHTVTMAELEELDKQAFDLGYNMGDFDDWYQSQPFSVRSHAKMKTVRESYNKGIDACIKARTKVLRLCVFIQGPPNVGKTYAATEALAGRRILPVGGGGTGKFDDLRPTTEAIIIDDDVCPNLLNMSDNFIRKAYHRGEGNQAWSGQYLIVTSNRTFEDWVRKCGIAKNGPNGGKVDNYAAVESRFYICRIARGLDGVNHLALTSPSKRGSYEEQTERLGLFRTFKEKFDATIAQYRPDLNQVDYSEDIEPVRPPLFDVVPTGMALKPTPAFFAISEEARRDIGIVYRPGDEDVGY